jgi:hypothetical protein
VNSKNILDALSNIDEKYILEAYPSKGEIKMEKSSLSKTSKFALAIAASIVLVVGGTLIVTLTDRDKGRSPLESTNSDGNSAVVTAAETTEEVKAIADPNDCLPYIFKYMQPYSVVIYDENGKATITSGGVLSQEEIDQMPEIASIGLTSDMGLFPGEEPVLAEPNTKVEYDLHGFLQNVYYLNYQLSPPATETTEEVKAIADPNDCLPYVFKYMQPNSEVVYDENGKATIISGGVLSQEEIDQMPSIASIGLTSDKGLLLGEEPVLAEPNTKIQYDLHGFMQNVYYLTPGTTDDYRLSKPLIDEFSDDAVREEHIRLLEVELSVAETQRDKIQREINNLEAQISTETDPEVIKELDSKFEKIAALDSEIESLNKELDLAYNDTGEKTPSGKTQRQISIYLETIEAYEKEKRSIEGLTRQISEKLALDQTPEDREQMEQELKSYQEDIAGIVEEIKRIQGEMGFTAEDIEYIEGLSATGFTAVDSEPYTPEFIYSDDEMMVMNELPELEKVVHYRKDISGEYVTAFAGEEFTITEQTWDPTVDKDKINAYYGEDVYPAYVPHGYKLWDSPFQIKADSEGNLYDANTLYYGTDYDDNDQPNTGLILVSIEKENGPWHMYPDEYKNFQSCDIYGTEVIFYRHKLAQEEIDENPTFHSDYIYYALWESENGVIYHIYTNALDTAYFDFVVDYISGL